MARPDAQAAGSTPAADPGDVHTCIDAMLAHAFAAGELSAQQLERVDAHIDRCRACHERVVAALGQPGRENGRASLEAGTLLAGRYQIVRFLGRGGMGEVYEAQDETLKERVALKCLAENLAENPRGVEYLKSEAQLARRVSHPNVCRVYDFSVDRGVAGAPRYFLTMELLSGHSLGKLIAGGALRPPLVANIARQLLLGLREAHRLGILHRDFKSDNVLLRDASDGSDNPEVVITDFGLSRLVSSEKSHVTTDSSCVGSAAYMAPEQVEGGHLARTTDIYGFGVVVFEMLTGGLPFVAESALATAVLRLRTPPPRPSEKAPQLPRAWDEFVLCCLARDPKRRFASADTALQALERFEPRAAQARARSTARRVAWPLAAALLVALIGQLWSARDTSVRSAAQLPSAPPRRAEPPAPAPELEVAPAPVQSPSAGLESCSPASGSTSALCSDVLPVPRTEAVERRAAQRDAPGTKPRATPRPRVAPPPPEPSPPAIQRDALGDAGGASRHPHVDQFVDPFR